MDDGISGGKLDRRVFLRLAGAAALAALGDLWFSALFPSDTEAKKRSKIIPNVSPNRYDVAYFWSICLESVLDYREEAEAVLGEDIAKDLHIVRDKGSYGLVFPVDRNKEYARRVAHEHSGLLQESMLEKAVEVSNSSHEKLYNICYAAGSDLEALKNDFVFVYDAIKKELVRELVIERQGNGYALVYRILNDEISTTAFLEMHSHILKSKGIRASVVRESNNEILYEVTNYYADEGINALAAANGRGVTLRPFYSDLEAMIRNYINWLRKIGSLSSDERSAWYVCDLATNETIVDINAGVPLQTASMVKPFVALAFFHKVKQGEQKYTDDIKRYMEAMIQLSRNKATNFLMRKLGGPRQVQSILSKGYGDMFRRLKIVEYVPDKGQTYRNKASLHDYHNFLYALWHNELPFSEEIKRLMALHNRDRLATGVEGIPLETIVYDKTGSTARLCGDMGILDAMTRDGRRHAYSVIGVIEKRHSAKNYPVWISSRSELIRNVSGIVYNEMKKRHGLL